MSDAAKFIEVSKVTCVNLVDLTLLDRQYGNQIASIETKDNNISSAGNSDFFGPGNAGTLEMLNVV